MLYAIAGDGAGNATEIKATLADLKEKAAKDEAEFWFVLEGKDDLTKTDAAILKWLQDNEVWFEVVGEDSDTYEGAQAFHQDTILDRMAAAEEEGAVFLALFINTEEDVDEDADLYALVEAAVEAGIEVRLLNGQMIRLQLQPDEATEEEPEAVEDTRVPTPDGDEDESQQAFTEAELKKMTVPELQAIARGQGVTPATKSKGDIIAAILGAPPVAAQLPAEGEAILTGVRTSGAMLVVLMNGSVHIKPISVEEAQALV